MSLEFSSATPEYRFHGRTAVEVRLLPLVRLLIAAPWMVAIAAMLVGLARWAGLWVAIVVMVIQFLTGMYLLLILWATPDEVTMRRRALEFPTIASYDETRLETYVILVEAAWDVMYAAGRPGPWLRTVLRTHSPKSAGRSHPRRLVSVPISAVRDLPPPQLRAVIAHEFGHQLIGGWVVASLESLCTTPISALLSTPTREFINILPYRRQWISRWELAALSLAAASYAVLTAALYPVLGPHIAPILAGICMLQPFAKAWLSWREEFLADQVATDLGYGAALCDHLEPDNRWIRVGFTATHPAWFNRQLRICIRMNELQPARRGGDADGVDFVAGL